MRQATINLFPEKHAECMGGPKTVVVFGTPRGGTSMVAGVVLGLGVPLGKSLPNNIEDPDFNPDYGAARDQEPAEHFERVISERNSEYNDWGFKYPRASRYISTIAPLLRNPHLVVVMRDPVPASLRALATSKKTPVEEVMKRMRMDQENMAHAERLNIPTLLVSYERAISKPMAFISEMAEFLGRDEPKNTQKLQEFMKPGSYKSASLLSDSCD